MANRVLAVSKGKTFNPLISEVKCYSSVFSLPLVLGAILVFVVVQVLMQVQLYKILGEIIHTLMTKAKKAKNGG